MERDRIFQVAFGGLMTGLILCATMMFRIPMPFTNGYIHLGDAMIFLAVLTLGKKRGSVAAGLGSALADLIGGYTHYVPWTFAIKAVMGLIMGLALEHFSENEARGGSTYFPEKSANVRSARVMSLRIRQMLAMSLAGLEMTAGYYIAASVMRGNWVTPLLSVPGNIVQFAVGVVLAQVIAEALQKTPAGRYFAMRM